MAYLDEIKKLRVAGKHIGLDKYIIQFFNKLLSHLVWLNNK